jgi:hypothetical protein
MQRWRKQCLLLLLLLDVTGRVVMLAALERVGGLRGGAGK